ncbi:MAG: SURF1 family protein [Woeseiaceae bacterium]|nr:SURF1 family protein [Woeseiaceae bacterium]
MNATSANKTDWLPYVIGTVVVAMLASLGLWQVARGLDKRAGLDAFSAEGGFQRYYDGMEVRPFQQLRVDGQYVGDRQILLDNMIVDGRVGHFVVTPLTVSADGPLLLVNRGWIERGPRDQIESQVQLGGASVTALGRVGRLPRAGMRMGDPFADAGDWPKHAVYPVASDVSDQLGRDVLPFVLLLDEKEPNGFVRQWEPEEMSASRHFGYAFQWFAMAAMLSALLIFRFWRKRKRR